MKRKARTIIGLMTAMAILVGCFGGSELDIEKGEGIYLETLDKEGTIEKIQIKDKDVKAINEVLPDRVVHGSGFVFAEGGYRIVLVKQDEEVRLYPYCGADLSMMRVGDEGSDFFGLDDDSEDYETLKSILSKYLDLEQYSGIYEWD
jgi:hypothetical protein